MPKEWLAVTDDIETSKKNGIKYDWRYQLKTSSSSYSLRIVMSPYEVKNFRQTVIWASFEAIAPFYTLNRVPNDFNVCESPYIHVLMIVIKLDMWVT